MLPVDGRHCPFQRPTFHYVSYHITSVCFTARSLLVLYSFSTRPMTRAVPRNVRWIGGPVDRLVAVFWFYIHLVLRPMFVCPFLTSNPFPFRSRSVPFLVSCPRLFLHLLLTFHEMSAYIPRVSVYRSCCRCYIVPIVIESDRTVGGL